MRNGVFDSRYIFYELFNLRIPGEVQTQTIHVAMMKPLYPNCFGWHVEFGKVNNWLNIADEEIFTKPKAMKVW